MPQGKEILDKAGLIGEFIGIGNLAIGYLDGEKRNAPDINNDYIK